MPNRIQSFVDSLHTSFHYPSKSSLDKGADFGHGRTDFSPLLFDIPIELRCLRTFNSIGFEQPTTTVRAVG